MLWKANIDIQFVAESSLALTHYVSGYVTKAERSNMQKIWPEVSESKSVYSRLWIFGVQIDVSMPHKRSRRLKITVLQTKFQTENEHLCSGMLEIAM